MHGRGAAISGHFANLRGGADLVRQVLGELGDDMAQPVGFALIETKPVPDCAAPLELIFPGGERLRISRGADAATLQLVMAALRA